jgi:hypothetical protein
MEMKGGLFRRVRIEWLSFRKIISEKRFLLLKAKLIPFVLLK